MNNTSAAAQLLDRNVSSDSLREWTDNVCVEQKLAEIDYRSILVFRIASEWMGIETAPLEEVTDASTVRRLPHRLGTLVQGIVSLRGEVLVCISLETLLGLQKQQQYSQQNPKTAPPRLVVCKTHAGKFAFVASEVYGVERYLTRELRPVPSTVLKSPNNYTAGILNWKDHLTIGCLDTARLLASIDKGLA